MKYQPVHDIKIERQIIGCLIYNKNLIGKADLMEDDFYSPKIKNYYKAIMELVKKKEPIDLESLLKFFQKSDSDTKELRAISADTEFKTEDDFLKICEILKEASHKRMFQQMCMDILANAENISKDDITNLLHRTIEDVYRRESQIVEMEPVMKNTLEFIERRSEHKDVLSGIPSGYLPIDRITDGFQRAEYYILAGRPGTGKTALGIAIALNASRQAFPIGFISIEMAERPVATRMISTVSQIDMWRLRKGEIDYAQWPQIHQACAELAELPVYWTFSAYNLSDITKSITSMVELYDTKLMIVDYLQLATNKAVKTREREIASISMALKHLSHRLNISMLALCQLNRNPEKEKRKPMLADLRESGTIEQDADVVMFLHKEQYTEPKGVIEVNVAKGRNIGLGKCKLWWNGPKQTFELYQP